MADKVSAVLRGKADGIDPLRLAPRRAAARPVVIADFKPFGKSTSEKLSAGAIESMLTVTLGEIESVEIVDREHIETILKEKEMELSALSASRQPRAGGRKENSGKMRSALNIIAGRYAVRDESIEITVRISDVETGTVTSRFTASGSLRELDRLLEDLSPRVLEGLSLEMTSEEEKKLRAMSKSIVEVSQYLAVIQGAGSSTDLLEAAKRAAFLLPDSAVVQGRLASAYRRTGKKGEALAAFEKQVSLQEETGHNSFHPYVQIATLHSELDEKEAALDAIHRAEKEADRLTHSGAYYPFHAEHLIADVYVKLKMPEKALDFFWKSAERSEQASLAPSGTSMSPAFFAERTTGTVLGMMKEGLPEPAERRALLLIAKISRNCNPYESIRALQELVYRDEYPAGKSAGRYARQDRSSAAT